MVDDSWVLFLCYYNITALIASRMPISYHVKLITNFGKTVNAHSVTLSTGATSTEPSQNSKIMCRHF